MSLVTGLGPGMQRTSQTRSARATCTKNSRPVTEVLKLSSYMQLQQHSYGVVLVVQILDLSQDYALLRDTLCSIENRVPQSQCKLPQLLPCVTSLCHCTELYCGKSLSFVEGTTAILPTEIERPVKLFTSIT